MANNIAFRLQPEGGDTVVRAAKTAEDALVGAQTRTANATQAAIAAADRQVSKLKEVAAQAAATAGAGSGVQARIDQLTGVTGGGNASARKSAMALYAADDAYEERARRLRAVIDPLGAAQDRLNDELREYEQLARRGAISSAELAKGQALARQKYDEATAALDRQGRGLSRLQVASRLNLARQGADVAVTAAMGMNPAMIAIQQGPQILDAMATSGLRLTPVMLGVAGVIGATATAAGVLAVAWHGGEASALAYERTITGLGRTSGLTAQEMEYLTERAAEQGRVTVAAAREQMAAYLSTGRIGGEVAQRLTTLGKDYASVMGVDASEATRQLATAMLEPDKAARELTRGGLGLLDQKTIDLIDSLVKSGDLLRAQKILLDALEPAVSGHAARVGEIESAWDAVGLSIRNAMHDLGTFLHKTRDERIAELENRISRTPVETAGRRRWQTQLFTERYLRDWAALSDREERPQEQANRDAMLERDRRERAEREGRGARRSAEAEARRAQQEAERNAREALQRTRREEDIEHTREMQIAQARQDWGHIRALEEEERVRSRIRQLVDDGQTQEAARTKALAEQAQLREALDVQMGREAQSLIDAASIEADRAAGLNRFAQITERRLELESRIVAYARVYQDIGTATTAALQDQLMIDQARADAMERIVEAAKAERRLRLAQASGDSEVEREADRLLRVERRAEELRQRENLNRDEAERRAGREIDEEDEARQVGRRRKWLDDLISDIRQGGVKSALSEQLEIAGDRFQEKLTDAAFEFGLALAKSLASQTSWGGSVVKWITRIMDFQIGKNAAGTDFWKGGLTWVGERGPELLDLPRGSKVLEADRAMHAARKVSTGGNSQTSFVFAPQIDARGAGPREIDRLEAKMDEMARSLPTIVPQIVNDGIARRIIG